MRALLLVVFASGCAGGAAAGWKRVTAQPRPSFTEPGDAVTLAPTPDTFPYDADTLGDCSSCPPR